MISLDSFDVDLMTEKLLTHAYELRDKPNYDAFLQVMESLLAVGRYLQERDGALMWAERQLFP